MENFFKKVRNVAEEIGGKAEEMRKSLIGMFKSMTEPNPTIENIAELILAHPGRKKKTINALAVNIHQYQVKKGDFIYYLETKGEKDEEILEVDVVEGGRYLLKYRLYSDLQLSDRYPLSKEAFFTLME